MSEAGTLGVFHRDSARSILVISDDGEIAVALAETVNHAYALIRDVRPREALDGFQACAPWPWMIVGDVTRVSDDIVKALRHTPVLALWHGQLPQGMPAHARSFERFAMLARALDETTRATMLGLRLAPGSGVSTVDGNIIASPELDALIAQHPRGFDMPLRRFRPAATALARAGIPLVPALDSETGMVQLVATSSGTPSPETVR